MSTSATATQVSQRKQYETQGIDGDHLDRSAFAQFQAWFDEANAHADIAEAAAMTLSTVELVVPTGQAGAAAVGRPSARVVLLKQFDRAGFTFYTNYDSRKGGELARNPFAALTFYWPPLHRSVRIGGRVERLAPAENRAYFDSRPLGSRIGAIASPQSQPIDGRATLEERVRAVEEKYGVVGAAGLNSSSAEAAQHDEKTAIDLPPYWGGFRLVPDEIEFWMGRLNRLHDRFRYTRDSTSEEDEWTITRLAP